MVHNDEEGKDYCTGFAFEDEFVDIYARTPSPMGGGYFFLRY